MEDSDLRKRRYRRWWLTEIIASIGLAPLAPAMKWGANPPSSWPHWIADVLNATYQNKAIWVLLVGLPALIVLARWRKGEIGRPAIWDAIKINVDEFREQVFKDRSAGTSHHFHRVTLFRPKRCVHRWRWMCWPVRERFLIPVVRSGHLTQKSQTRFLIPDNADDAEGVAGQTWCQRATVPVSKLPELKKGSCPPEMVKEYMKETCLTETRLQQEIMRKAPHPLPRSFLGVPVETGRGELWGVVVLDSMDDQQIAYRMTRDIESFARVMGKLVDKV